MSSPPRPTGRMTWRARAYLIALTIRGTFTGVLCFVYAYGGVTVTPSITVLKVVLPLATWGILYCGSGLLAFIAAIRMSEHVARVALVCSAALAAGWFGMFTVSALHEGVHAAPLVALLALFSGVFAWKDVVASAIPLRTPLEDLLVGVEHGRPHGP